jgi:hypothetical protein
MYGLLHAVNWVGLRLISRLSYVDLVNEDQLFSLEVDNNSLIIGLYVNNGV